MVSWGFIGGLRYAFFPWSCRKRHLGIHRASLAGAVIEGLSGHKRKSCGSREHLAKVVQREHCKGYSSSILENLPC